jgi:hypothetical protein
MWPMIYFALILAFVWGGVWAVFLQFVPLGQFLVRKRTWITVWIGAGMDLLIALLVVPWEYWKLFALIFAFSSIGITLRSLANEWDESKEVLDAIKNTFGEQDDLGS